MTLEGLILVSSMTERGLAEKNDKAGVDTTVAKPDSNIVSKKQRGLAAKEDGQVSQALRTVYQRAVDEDIPLEMLDLLKKLD
jgi:hypothetical protein